MQGRISSALFGEWISKGSNDTCDSENLETVNMVDICTIHSFCERLIHRFGLQINIAPNFKVKSFKKETTHIISSVVNEYCANPLLSDIPAYAIERLVSVFLSNNSNRGLRIDEKLLNVLSKPAPENQYWNAFKVLFLEIYNRVEKEVEESKQNYNVITPNDLIRLTADLLRIPSVVKRVSEKYRYVFIDEFQDTNKDQFNLVDCLIKHGVKVFLVGDDKQSIYAFRGADVQNSQEMHSLVKKENKKENLVLFYFFIIKFIGDSDFPDIDAEDFELSEFCYPLWLLLKYLGLGLFYLFKYLGIGLFYLFKYFSSRISFYSIYLIILNIINNRPYSIRILFSIILTHKSIFTR